MDDTIVAFPFPKLKFVFLIRGRDTWEVWFVLQKRESQKCPSWAVRPNQLIGRSPFVYNSIYLWKICQFDKIYMDAWSRKWAVKVNLMRMFMNQNPILHKLKYLLEHTLLHYLIRLWMHTYILWWSISRTKMPRPRVATITSHQWLRLITIVTFVLIIMLS